MAENKNIVIRLMADTASYEAAMTRAGSTAKTVASGMENTGRKSALITSGLTAAGLAAAAFGVASIKMAADFDQQMSTVQANTGATGAELDQLRQAAIEAGASTVYSASESADAINDLGKAGMSVTDILSGGLTGALNLAASDGMAVGDAAEYMANALSMFHLSGSQASQVADTLAAGAGKAVGNVSDFGEALNNCGAQANSFGMSIQETTGVLSLFAQNGTIGAEAGTQLNSMLMKLAAPSNDAAATMKELGISAYDASGNFVGMANFAGQLQKAEKNLTQEQRNQANATIFGSYAIKAANYLYDAGEKGVRNWTKAVSESGYAAEQAAAKNNNLKGDLENLSGSMESLMISIGEGAQGPLRKLVQGLDTLVDSFASLPAGAQQTIIVMAALGGVLGGVHKAASNLNGSTSTMANNIGLAIDPIQRMKSALASAQTAFQMFRASGMSAQEQMEAFGTSASRAELKTAGFKAVGSSVMSLLGGPWGIALTVAGVALTSFIERQQKAKEATEQLQSALESGSDVRSTIADSYQKMNFAGADMTHWMGEAKVSLTDMTSAAMGNKDATDKVNAALKEYGKQGHSQMAVAQKMRDSIKDEAKAYSEAKEQTKQKAAATKNAVDADGNGKVTADATQAYLDLVSADNEHEAGWRLYLQCKRIAVADEVPNTWTETINGQPRESNKVVTKTPDMTPSIHLEKVDTPTLKQDGQEQADRDDPKQALKMDADSIGITFIITNTSKTDPATGDGAWFKASDLDLADSTIVGDAHVDMDSLAYPADWDTGTLKGVREGDTHTDRAIVTGTPLVECAPSNGDPFNDKTDGGEDTDPEYSTGDVTEIDGKQLCADTQVTSNTDDWNGYRAKPLASTGTAVLGLAGGALAVLLAGGSLLVFRKRHRAQGSGRHTAVNAGK